MRKVAIRTIRVVLAAGLAWLTATVFFGLHSNRATVSMALLLEVVAVATLGDWILSVLTSAAASLAFSWYFIDAIRSLRITTPEGAITFSAMAITALTVSRLSVQARRRADEAIRRREEMERLQQLGRVLLTADTIRDATEKAAEFSVRMFGLEGAAIRIEEGDLNHFTGSLHGEVSTLDLGRGSWLRLYGRQPSVEVRVAVGQMIGMVLDRVRAMEQKSKEEATRRSEEIQVTVLSALAHNFKTPLTSIKVAASVLRGSRSALEAHGSELIAVIDEEADRLERLIGESLDLARVESRLTHNRSGLCSVMEIVDAATERVRRYLGNRDLRIKVSPNLAPVAGDRFLYEQMLTQVMDNAWKYSKPGASIEVEAVAGEKCILLTVRNEGSEILSEEKDKIFDKFYRGAVHSKVEGTGLGLAIAKVIAEAHGGSLWLDVEPEGPAFRFMLPVGANGENG